MPRLSTRQRLHRLFDRLDSLNAESAPDATAQARRLGAALRSRFFAEFATRTERLLARYHRSPVKRVETTVLKDYFRQIREASRRLASGEHRVLPDPAGAPPEPVPASLALVPRLDLMPAAWLRLLREAAVPDRLRRAVSAASVRNLEVETVLETAFTALHAIAPAKAFAWAFAYLGPRRGRIDADVMRDLLRVWQRQPELPPAAVAWAMDITANDLLRVQWPAAAREADRLIRRAALETWSAQLHPPAATLRLLERIAAGPDAPADRLTRWLDGAIADLGHHTQAVMALSHLIARAADPEARRRLGFAAAHRIRAVDALYRPLLLLADVLVDHADGTRRFALALVGVSPANLQQWRRALEAAAADAIRRALLDDLRAGRPALETLRACCLGDPSLFRAAAKELDLLSRQFDSMAGRDRAVAVLAANYASLREEEVLALKVTRRYRLLMQVLHEDSLRRLLPLDEFEAVRSLDFLGEVAGLAAEARRFLEKRRARELDVDDALAEELAFERSVRTRRLRLVRAAMMPAAGSTAAASGQPAPHASSSAAG